MCESIEPRILLSTTWSFSKLADFTSANRTSNAGLVIDSGGNLYEEACSVTFLASGTYTLQVTASDGIHSVSSHVQVTLGTSFM